MRKPSQKSRTALAGSIGQGLDPAVKHIGAAVPNTTCSIPAFLRALGDQLADGDGRRRDPAPVLMSPLTSPFERRGRRQRLPRGVIDDLGIDVPRRAEHRQPEPPLAGLAELVARWRWRRRRRIRLPSWPWATSSCLPCAGNRLVAVLDALALVRLGRAIAADFGRDLADALAVGTADRDRGRPLAVDLHIRRDRKHDIVAIAELQRQRAARHRGTHSQTHPVDLEVAGRPVRDAGDHVVDQRPGRAP